MRLKLVLPAAAVLALAGNAAHAQGFRGFGQGGFNRGFGAGTFGGGTAFGPGGGTMLGATFPGAFGNGFANGGVFGNAAGFAGNGFVGNGFAGNGFGGFPTSGFVNGFNGFNPAFAAGFGGTPVFVGNPYGVYPMYGGPVYDPGMYGPQQVPVPVAVPVPVPVEEQTPKRTATARTRVNTDPKTPEDFDRQRRLEVRQSVAGSREEFRDEADRADRQMGTRNEPSTRGPGATPARRNAPIRTPNSLGK